jgi:hypothetical protein
MPSQYIDFFNLNSFTAPIADNWTILGLAGNDTAILILKTKEDKVLLFT